MNKMFTGALLAASAIAQVPSGGYSFSYTDAQAQISLELSQKAYCGKDAYMTQAYTGVVNGFKPTKTIYNLIWDV
jgi:hypothetical protein